jgi:hypothetical protein
MIRCVLEVQQRMAMQEPVQHCEKCGGVSSLLAVVCPHCKEIFDVPSQRPWNYDHRPTPPKSRLPITPDVDATAEGLSELVEKLFMLAIPAIIVLLFILGHR